MDTSGGVSGGRETSTINAVQIISCTTLTMRSRCPLMIICPFKRSIHHLRERKARSRDTASLSLPSFSGGQRLAPPDHEGSDEIFSPEFPNGGPNNSDSDFAALGTVSPCAGCDHGRFSRRVNHLADDALREELVLRFSEFRMLGRRARDPCVDADERTRAAMIMLFRDSS